MTGRSEYGSELRTYVTGLVLAVALSAIPFAAVGLTDLSRRTLLWIVGACAIVQVPVHFRCFLHIDMSRQKRDDLQLILFSSLIVLLMVGGTIWIMTSAHALMM